MVNLKKLRLKNSASLINSFKLTKSNVYIITIFITISLGIFLAYYIYNNVDINKIFSFFNTDPIPVPKKTLQLKTRKELFNNNPQIDVIFEEEDVRYYTEQPRLLLDYVDFDLNNNEVDIPEFDKQNVHDSYVQKGIRKLYNDIEDNRSDKTLTIQEIISDKDFDREKYPDIQKVLETIQTRNAVITNLDNNTELELLNKIWGTAKNNENIKQFLFTQLQDSYENNNVVCPTGISTRLVSSLSVENPENLPKTKDTITQEMMYTAAKLQKTLSNDKNYSDMPEIDQTAEFKSQLLDKYVDDYKGILTKEEIVETIDPWIDHV
jgi:hypothetical protein